MDVRIPDIGDAQDVEVIELCVAAGDTVAVNDALIVIESDKASMEVPAPAAGTVQEVLVSLGDLVNEGDAIVVLEAVAVAAGDAAGTEEAAREAPGAATPADETAAPQAREPRGGESDGLEKLIGELDQLIDSADAGTKSGDEARPGVTGAPAVEVTHDPSAPGAKVYAGPATRRLARELGVDLTDISGSGGHGRIVKDDVKAFVKQSMVAEAAPARGTAAPTIDFSRFGEVEEVPLSRVQARGAANLARSWAQVVHVTQHDEADVTELESFRTSLRAEAQARDTKLTPLPLIMKACTRVLTDFPQFNASLNAEVTALIHKRYMHIGFAVDTEAGLVVPVVRDANAKGVWQLAGEIERLSAAAREGRLKPDEIQGGCFTISSLGAIGGTGFTPVVNAPEVAILGVARLTTKPVWNGEAFVPREILPLSLSYDHRAINGAEAGRFMAALTSLLADFRRLAL
ncbi:MAG: 2-oxo acid dehydrogenase subunit E2 [Gammaproteobacteria bacterium]|nr:2-oxo acid dehydrogenase subunit E2 [Gammaproteobacteria bacterium]